MNTNEKKIKRNEGRWTRAQHEKFIDALQKYGRDWLKIAKKLKKRTVFQIRSHAQKFFMNMSKVDIEAYIGADDDSCQQPIQQPPKKKKITKKTNPKQIPTPTKSKPAPKKQRKPHHPQKQLSTIQLSSINPQNTQDFNQTTNTPIICQVDNIAPKGQQTTSKHGLFLDIFEQYREELLLGGNFISLSLGG